MKDHSTITVKPWLFDKIQDEMRKYHFLLVCEYTDVNGISMADHSKLRVEEVIAETEKAYKVKLDVETVNDNPRTYTAWLPKSAIVDEGEKVVYKVVFEAVNEIGEEHLDELTNNGQGFTEQEAEYIALNLRRKEDVRDVRIKVANLKTYEELRMMVCSCDDIKKVAQIEDTVWRSIKIDIVEAEDLTYMLSQISRELYLAGA